MDEPKSTVACEEELLSFKQLSARFPLPHATTEQTWAKTLSMWRTSGKLKERKDFRYSTREGQICRVYVVKAVAALIATESRSDKCRPNISYLSDTYYEDLLEILKRPSRTASKY